jgi:hypothetical protein
MDVVFKGWAIFVMLAMHSAFAKNLLVVQRCRFCRQAEGLKLYCACEKAIRHAMRRCVAAAGEGFAR